MLKRIDKNNKEQLQSYLQSRSQEIESDILIKVSEIINEVRMKKDEALKKYTYQFDKIKVDTFKVTEEEIDEAIKQCDPAFMNAMKQAKENITFFHKAQKQNDYILHKEYGIYLGQCIRPIESVGIYVPGGRAQYPSSVLMNVIPAKVAGVQRIVMVTPPDPSGQIHPNIAYAAKLAGVHEIYKVGGAQAIAALAYGTNEIPNVDKIVGPGNIYVAAAKKLVFGKVDIDHCG